jgi:hypothetical protein
METGRGGNRQVRDGRRRLPTRDEHEAAERLTARGTRPLRNLLPHQNKSLCVLDRASELPM